VRQPEAQSRMETSLATAQICFGKVHHTRLRPAEHKFNYGVYFMRLPLRSLQARQHKFPALFSWNRFNLLSFHERDHGAGQGALLPWIDRLLAAEGIHDANGEVWLQAFPRVLGFVFNPVAFWFCHRPDGALRAVLCEVRNTFGERHCYLLDTGDSIANGAELHARKVFHVSPFCAVEGSYRFRFLRSLRDAHGLAVEHTVARIDHDDAQGLLINTSVAGVGATVTTRTVLKAFFLYPLMTLGVIVKIHLQALRLWRKRVPFFTKPPAPSTEITR
jgi:DUF1365 family protein